MATTPMVLHVHADFNAEEAANTATEFVASESGFSLATRSLRMLSHRA
jgi:hypothetical protein